MLRDLDDELAAVPGTISVYVARLGADPAYTREADATHYAASTMKAAVLAALYRRHARGELDLDAPVAVRDTFPSAAPGHEPFANDPAYDNDDEPWRRLGGTAPLRWLARRMIVRSSNLATNICLTHAGLPEVADVWRIVGATHSVTARGIEDAAAREAGITNLVTAADLARLFAALAGGNVLPAGAPLANEDDRAEMLDVLAANECREVVQGHVDRGLRRLVADHRPGDRAAERHEVVGIAPDQQRRHVPGDARLGAGYRGARDPPDLGCLAVPP